MNKINLRLAKISFNVLRAEEVAQKHWKTDEEIYSVSKWQRYLDNAKKRPKVHPTVVPDKKLNEAENLKKKMMEKGATWEEWQDAVEKKFSPKKLKRENVYETFGVGKKWDAIEKQKKEEKQLKRNQTKQTKRKNRAQEVAELKEANLFVYRDKKFIKHKTRFSGKGAEIFDKIIKPVINENRKEDEEEDRIKKPLSKYDQDILKNQLLQFHKDKPNVNRRWRTNDQLKQKFLREMNPNAYANIDAFNEAKKRIQNMNSNEFMAMVHSIWADDEEENVSIETPKEKSFEDEISEIKYN